MSEGGSAAFASSIMLGPRLGRYDFGVKPLPLGNPVNAVMGLFVLWWGWLAFNSGSTYGLSGAKWHYAARAAVMTMLSSFGGGCSSILYSFARLKGQIEVLDIINGILGSLVAVTAGCFLYAAWEALLVGSIGALLACTAMPLLDKIGVDDPVGATAVHAVGGIWGVLAVGIFAENPYPLQTTNGRSGLIKGGGWYLLGVQTLSCVCLAIWSFTTSMILLFLINKVVTIRMEVHHELLGADLTEHRVRHGKVGVSRAVSVLGPILTSEEYRGSWENVGLNPAHLKKLDVVRQMARKRKCSFLKALKGITRNKNFGINFAHKLLPKRLKQNKKATKNVKVSSGVNGNKVPVFAWVN